MDLHEIARIVQGRVIANNASDAIQAEKFSTDSRQITRGQIFIALTGDNFDGHDFVSQAWEKGAVAAIVSRELPIAIPQILVSDTLEAVTRLAQHHRRQFDCTVIAVTGSCGKTTSKMLLASVFAQQGNVLANPASFNNNIGVPLTLLQLTAEHEFAVTELGANHHHEISQLTRLVQPRVAIITNAGSVHLEGFGSVQGVAQAKGEIFEGLGSEGVAIINADDQYADYWSKLAEKHRIIKFGLEQPAEITAKAVELDANAYPTFLLVTPQGEVSIKLPLIGRHNVYNALIAAAAAYACDINLTAIKAGLETAIPVAKRLVEFKNPAGTIVIDDTYNANPSSMLAAIQLLSLRSQDSILVMGDMLELGGESAELHRQVGVQAKHYGIKQLFCLGKDSTHAANAFGDQGFCFNNHDELINALKTNLDNHHTVLVKGSRGMKMEKIVAALK